MVQRKSACVLRIWACIHEPTHRPYTLDSEHCLTARSGCIESISATKPAPVCECVLGAIQGSTSSRVNFPTLPAGGYTLFHVIRYAGSGPTQRRIITGPLNNTPTFFSGFGSSPLNNGKGGTGWSQHGSGNFFPAIRAAHLSEQWILSTDQWYRYHSQGVNRTANAFGMARVNNAASARPAVPFSINNAWFDRTSDWAMAALIIYRRELNETEIMRMEDHLSSTYGIPLGRLPWAPSPPTQRKAACQRLVHSMHTCPHWRGI